MTAEHDNTGDISRALVSNDWLGATLVFEMGEKENIPLLGNESQAESGADEVTLRETVSQLEQAGVLVLSQTGDLLSLTPDGLELYTKLVASLEKSQE